MVFVVKANGEKELFSEEKLKRSIYRAGVPSQLIEQAVAHIKSRLYDHIPTSVIYHHISEFLAKSEHPYASSKYSLKQAIAQLGPTGYPFEDFVAEILKKEGYSTEVRTTLQGRCIPHEIDIIAQKDNKRTMIEAKFHNFPSTKTDVHVVLYTKARFEDIKEKNNLDEVWVITNTKVTADSISYARCNGIKITSWSYPEGDSLADLIERSALTPITALKTLSQSQKQDLLRSHIVLCKEMYQNQSSLMDLNLPEDKKQAVLAEAAFVCNL